MAENLWACLKVTRCWLPPAGEARGQELIC
jgi:hypothetical protein